MPRWAPALGWLAGLGAYAVAASLATDRGGLLVHTFAWTLAPVIAVVECLRTAGQSNARARIGWIALALACSVRLLGHLYWEYYIYLRGTPMPYPIVGQIIVLIHALLVLKALSSLPEARAETRFTPQHLGNLGLIACCFAVTIVVTLFEPVMHSTLSTLRISVSFIDGLVAASTFFVALYYLWTYRWDASWMPMLLVAGTGVYSVGNFLYVYGMITGATQLSAFTNASWVATFALFALAARERRTVVSNIGLSADRVLQRERLLEAVIPALLIIIMVVVGFSATAHLTPRVMTIAVPLAILFAIILGAREAWIQGEAQRLASELRDANEKLRDANTELRDSETRYRDLNQQLEQRVAERTSQLTSAYQELEGFAYAVAHDLKAPLRAIDGFGHLLSEELRERPQGKSEVYLARIRNNAVRMSVLIDDLLSYSRLERRHLESGPVDLQSLVQRIVGESSDELTRRGVDLRVDVPPFVLKLDTEGLGLALRNLIENAVKFTRAVESPRIEIQAKRASTGIVVSVRDNGIGFDLQYHDQIFKLFHRLHRESQYPGTGIGLALVRKAVERMGGRVWADSKEGQGATFYIELPLHCLDGAYREAINMPRSAGGRG